MARPNVYNPADRPGDENYNSYHDYLESGQCDAIGPAGTTTNIEHDEKGILENGVFEAIRTLKTAKLQGTHPRVGIYGQDNS